MATLSIVYWRDIPAQIIVKSGRRAVKRELPLRFTEAIDKCAMKTGAAQSQDYLAEWRRGKPQKVSENLEAEAQKAFHDIEEKYSREFLVRLVNQGGEKEGLA